jgi:hypothetical protein
MWVVSRLACQSKTRIPHVYQPVANLKHPFRYVAVDFRVNWTQSGAPRSISPAAVGCSWLCGGRDAAGAPGGVIPIGIGFTGEVIARQPFGVFLSIDGVPGAIGLAEITAMPANRPMPSVGASVAGAVIWHVERNRQIKVRLAE